MDWKSLPVVNPFRVVFATREPIRVGGQPWATPGGRHEAILTSSHSRDEYCECPSVSSTQTAEKGTQNRLVPAIPDRLLELSSCRYRLDRLLWSNVPANSDALAEVLRDKTPEQATE